MPEDKVIVPIIHNNGTRKSQLMKPYMDAYYKLDDAKTAFLLFAPHGRDYYQEPGLIKLAMVQHKEMLKTITDLQDKIRKILEGIDAQETNDK